MLPEPGPRVRSEACLLPVPAGPAGCSGDTIVAEYNTVGMRGVGKIMGRGDERTGEFGNLVDQQIRPPIVDDLVEIRGSSRQLIVGENPFEEERANLLGRQRFDLWKCGRAFFSRHLVGTGRKVSDPETIRLRPDDGARGEGDLVSRRDERPRQRNHRQEMPYQRTAREQHTKTTASTTVRPSGCTGITVLRCLSPQSRLHTVPRLAGPLHSVPARGARDGPIMLRINTGDRTRPALQCNPSVTAR